MINKETLPVWTMQLYNNITTEHCTVYKSTQGQLQQAVSVPQVWHKIRAIKTHCLDVYDENYNRYKDMMDVKR